MLCHAVRCTVALQLSLRSIQLAVAAGGGAWLAMNAALSVWNAYLPLMQRERYAGLAGLLLPLVQALLQVRQAWSALQLPFHSSHASLE